ncbi:hypothetical protein ABVT39_003437 [Epinephelus coioides]
MGLPTEVLDLDLPWQARRCFRGSVVGRSDASAVKLGRVIFVDRVVFIFRTSLFRY